MSEILTAADWQKEFDKKINAVLSNLEGLSVQHSQRILESAIFRLSAHSYIQLPEAEQLNQPNQ
jgi:hypothetical protein